MLTFVSEKFLRSYFMYRKIKRCFKAINLLLLLLLIQSSLCLAQAPQGDPRPPIKDTVATGIAVSPGTLKFTCKPGGSESHVIKISNSTNKAFSFQVNFSDYVQNNVGQPMWTKNNASKSKYALSKWVTVSPAFFTVEGGQTQKITVTITMPSADSDNHAAWTVLSIDQVHKKQPLPTPNGDKSVAMGVIPSMGFGVYIYENPPNVKVNNVEIQNFICHDTAYTVNKKDTVIRQLYMKATNTGDGLSYCISYAEVTDLQTGKSFRLGTKQITILPGYTREFVYQLPNNLPLTDSYSAIGVIYFGDKVPKKVAKLSFTIH
ncbi:MAG TPA: DUF916 domain-containing protein [Bacteroidia bacterium]|nr:DUF916 domain-containing protein [Bacteroidia bacterium]